MGQPHFEVPTGAIDGVNTVFTVSIAYAPGSTAVFQNGVLLEPSLVDGWVETDPDAGVITLKEAPQGGTNPDTLQVFFLDTLQTVETSVEGIEGTISAADDLSGLLFETPVVGSLSSESSLSGLIVEDTVPLVGSLESEEAIVGLVEVCDV